MTLMDQKYYQRLIGIGIQETPLSRREYERYQQQRTRHEAEAARLIEEARSRGVSIVVPTGFNHLH